MANFLSSLKQGSIFLARFVFAPGIQNIAVKCLCATEGDVSVTEGALCVPGLHSVRPVPASLAQPWGSSSAGSVTAAGEVLPVLALLCSPGRCMCVLHVIAITMSSWYPKSRCEVERKWVSVCGPLSRRCLQDVRLQGLFPPPVTGTSPPQSGLTPFWAANGGDDLFVNWL